MESKVDVLAVMAEDAEFIDGIGESGDDLREAREAVSELIQAADEAGVRLSLVMEHSEDLVAHMRLCAALARVQGA